MIDPQRRSFLRWCIHGMGALFSVIVGLPAIAYLLDPRNRPPRARGLRPVEGIKISELKDDVPKEGVIRNVRQDAWTYHPNDIVGRVWVVKFGNGDKDLRIFTTICPHMGCSINASPGQSAPFACPCHGATFKLEGSRANAANPAKRGMDLLENWERIPDPANPDPTNRDLLLVEYLNFSKDSAEKIVKA